MDWNRLYPNAKPRRIKPAYLSFCQGTNIGSMNLLNQTLNHKSLTPGAIAEAVPLNGVINHKSQKLHPLVHDNTSTSEEQRFSSTFTGEEFYLKDHQVNGEKILPGVAYLEIAYAALVQATDGNVKNSSIQLNNIVWAKPIVASNNPQVVHIGLFPEQECIAYEIYTQREAMEEAAVHSQGVATFKASGQIQSLSLTDLQKKIQQSCFNANQCYQIFRSIGIDYGLTHQGINQIFVGNNEVLAKLLAPISDLETKDKYTLHLGLLDAALQASIALTMNNHEPPTINHQPSVPFALERIEIIHPCAETMWSWVRFSSISPELKTSNSVAIKDRRKLDIDLCDEQGRICVKMRGMDYQKEVPPSTKTESQVQWTTFSLSGDKNELGHRDANFSVEKKAEWFVQQLLADQLRRPVNEIETERGYYDMGLTSLGLVNVTQGIQDKIDKEFQTNLLFEYTTVSDLSAFLAANYSSAFDRLIVRKDITKKPAPGKMTISHSTAMLPRKKRQSIASGRGLVNETPSPEKKAQGVTGTNLSLNVQSQFPELIPLNNNIAGRPVFWLHGGLGGVQPYHVIAKVSQRPFYGIQARGYQTERSPLHGIQAMVAYYIHIIQSVQPIGPYDLGGYSQGGMLAYEVARQLQEFGQVVDTITMLDTFDDSVEKTIKVSAKTEVLQAVNTALSMTIVQDLEKMKKTLIHRDELDVNLDNGAFQEQLISLAKQHGLKKTEIELQKMIKQMAKAQHAYEMQAYSIVPLLNPQAITCYYFRNKNGLLFGELAPFFTTIDNELPLDHKNYWKEWQQQFPNFHVMDVDASNHMMFLLEPKVCETILSFCERLYSEKGILPQFLTAFKKKTKKIHGSIKLKAIRQP